MLSNRFNSTVRLKTLVGNLFSNDSNFFDVAESKRGKAFRYEFSDKKYDYSIISFGANSVSNSVYYYLQLRSGSQNEKPADLNFGELIEFNYQKSDKLGYDLLFTSRSFGLEVISFPMWRGFENENDTTLYHLQKIGPNEGYELALIKQSLYLKKPLLSDYTLKDWIESYKDSGPNPTDTLTIIWDIISTLSELHSKKTLHLGINPTAIRLSLSSHCRAYIKSYANTQSYEKDGCYFGTCSLSGLPLPHPNTMRMIKNGKTVYKFTHHNDIFALSCLVLDLSNKLEQYSDSKGFTAQLKKFSSALNPMGIPIKNNRSDKKELNEDVPNTLDSIPSIDKVKEIFSDLFSEILVSLPKVDKFTFFDKFTIKVDPVKSVLVRIYKSLSNSNFQRMFFFGMQEGKPKGVLRMLALFRSENIASEKDIESLSTAKAADLSSKLKTLIEEIQTKVSLFRNSETEEFYSFVAKTLTMLS